MEEAKEKDIENLMRLLDDFASSDTGRLKVLFSDEMEQGQTSKQSHHGRCDIGSPWAKGLAFDVLEDEKNS